MAIGDALAKNSTYQNIIDLAKIKGGALLDAFPTDSLLIKQISLACQKWAKILIGVEHPFYVKPEVSISITGSANPYSVNLTGQNPFPEKVLNVVHKTTGGTRTLVNLVSPIEAENFLALTNTNATSIVGVWEGDSINLYAGGSFTITTASDACLVTYIRQAIVSSVTVSSYPDVPDSIIPVVIAEVIADIKSGKGMDITRETKYIDDTYAEIMKGTVS